MINILITGGAGHIGASLVNNLLLKDGVNVVVIDNLLTGKKENIGCSERVKFIEADINESATLEMLLDLDKFDYVFHYSAVVGVKRTQDNPLLVLKDIEGIKNILTLSTAHQIERIYFASSSEVYGEPVEIPQHELTTPLNSRIPYAIVKNVGESFIKSFYQEHNLNFTIFRFFNTYGPFQSEDFVISKFIKLALNNEDITIYGDGTQTRTFLHVKDNVNFAIKCLENNFCNNDIVNVGSDNEISIIDLAHTIIRLINSKSKIKHLPPLKDGDMTRRMPDLKKFHSIQGDDLISLDIGILELLKEFKNA
jgi:UDP-glucose 4-epimerase